MKPTIRSAPADALACNFDAREMIRAYWARRAETFDLSYGHKLRSSAELEGWAELVRSHAPSLPGSNVLELACGTGEFTRVLLALGCKVDALDFCEPMLAKAREKHGAAAVRFHLADAEQTMMPEAGHHAIICRNLVWTLVDPQSAFRDWLRVLEPGGHLVIVDGDWVRTSRRSRFFGRLSALVDRLAGAPRLWDQSEHERIMATVHFRDGLTAGQLKAMLADAGFRDIRSGPLAGIGRLQFASASWSERLRLLASYERTFVVSARKPQ